MNWEKKYHREQRADWEDLARAVRASVTMGDAIALYVPGVTPRLRRIPCPLHNGKDYNFSFTDTGYKCFVCNETGDVIKFAELMCGLRSRTDAIKQLNDDFRLNLPIGREVTRAENSELKRRREEAKARQEQEKRLLGAYHNAMDKFASLDVARLKTAPESPLDDFREEYIFAIKNIDGAWYDVEETLNELYRFYNQKEGDERLNKEV